MAVEVVELVKVHQSCFIVSKAVVLEYQDLNFLHFFNQIVLLRFVFKFLDAHFGVAKVFAV